MATFVEIATLKNRLFLEMDSIHQTSNLAWDEARKKASANALDNGSEDFRALAKAIKDIGYKNVLTAALNNMTLPSSGLPLYKVSAGSVLRDEIQRLLMEINSSNKSIAQVEEEAKKLIIEKYRLVKDAAHGQGEKSAIPKSQSASTGQSFEVQPGKAEVVISALQQLRNNGQSTNVWG